MEPLRVLDLFSGVGAYSLGLERTGGFKTVAFCEIEEYPRRILRKHWPDVRIYENVCDLSGDRLAADGIVPEWIVAGWPCQDISSAGTGRGLDGARSGLWAEIARLAGDIRPLGLLLENSSNLLGINGGADFGKVLGDLASLGYDAEWHCLPAAAFDAPHIRDRLWIVAVVADADDAGRQQHELRAGRNPSDGSGGAGALADRDGRRRSRRARKIEQAVGRGQSADGSSAFADADKLQGGQRSEPAGQRGRQIEAEQAGLGGSRGIGARAATPNPYGLPQIGSAIARAERHTWEPEPGVGRVVTGCPNRVDRIHCLGNLNPPIVPETIGRAILSTLGRAA